MARYGYILLCLMVTALPAVLLAEGQKTVAIIGTGDMGDSLGPRLAGLGYQVIYGSRDPEGESVRALVARTGADARATTQRQAAQAADIVILAVPWPAMEHVAQGLGDTAAKILVDVSTPTRQAADGYLESLVASSSAEMIQRWNPQARVVKTLFAGAYVIDEPMILGRRVSTYVAADDRAAKQVVAAMAAQLGLSPLDAGPLRYAQEIEAWARLWFVPALQKRELGYELSVQPSNYWYCNWDDAWYRPVRDNADLAQFPQQNSPAPACASR